MISGAWLSPPNKLNIPKGEAHVWRATLDVGPSRLQTLHATLSQDELIRAKRYRFSQDQDRFIAARGMKREILGNYVNLDPGQLQFDYNSYGKPYLLNIHNHIQFNLTHANGLVLIAVTSGLQVGVDLEFVRENIFDDEIAETFFSPAEVCTLRSLPSNEQARAFFTCWTRKEAFIKGVGMGLSIPLDQFEVSLDPKDPPALLMTRWESSEASRWSICPLDPGPGFIGSLAVRGIVSNLMLWDYE